jgi:hypothetical protein
MKKLRVTLKRTGNVVEFLKTMREGRFPVAHVPEAKAAVPRGLEALILAQSDVPTTGALNLMMKWERLWRKERVMRLLCVVPVSAELCGFYCCYSRKSRCLYCLLCCCVFDWPTVMFTEPSRLICIRVFDFYLLQPDSL